MATKSDNVLLGDRYEILAPIGSGTAATVYRARDRRTGVLRAAKLLAPENAANPKVLARFEDEFRILRTLHHPHLAEVYDYGWTPEGGRYLIMELVDGVPLDQFFRENPSDIWAILYELCETLTFVHNHKLLHQDIKPSNILVKRTTAYGPDLPLVKLIDFGLMYRRDTGAEVELVGTPEYMAPEVARGDSNLTRAVDYYSLGATLFELLVGRPPFVGRASEVLRAHLEREPVIEEEELEWAELYPHVRALLSKDWRSRLEAFEEFRRAVANRLTGGIEELDRAYRLARDRHVATVTEQISEKIGTWLKTLASGKASTLDLHGPVGPIRSVLLDTLCADCAVKGIPVIRLAGDASDVLGLKASNTPQIERFDKAIDRLNLLGAPLIVIDDLEGLAVDVGSFIRYLSTRRELATYQQSPIHFLVARRWPAAHPLDAYLPSNRIALELPFDRDAMHAPHNAQAASKSSFVLTFLEGGRSSECRRILAYVASHFMPVPVAWAQEFSGASPEDFAKELDSILTLHLATKVLANGCDALAIADDVRAAATEVVSRVTQSAIHRDLADRMTRETLNRPSASAYDVIARHYAAADEHRLATLSGLRSIKAAKKEGSLARVERFAQANLERFDQSSKHSSAARRYVVKQFVSALWSRNQHTRARFIIDEYVVKRGDSIPPALLPKYIRGILDADGPASALSVLESVDCESYCKRTRQELQIEKALLYWHMALYHDSLRELDELAEGNVLTLKDRYRLTIYRAMNMSGLGRHDDVEVVLRDSVARAQADACYDEYVLMSAILAQTLNILGKPRESLKQIALALPIPRRRELYLRVNLLYRLAAAAYQDLGQMRKATGMQQKAIALASALGLPQFEAMSWSRLADYERVSGNFGNALRYLDKTRRAMATSSFEADRAKIDLTVMELHLWLRSPELDGIVASMTWIEGIKEVNQRGRYFAVLGSYLTDLGQWDRARRCLDEARDLLQNTGYVDNLVFMRRARLRLALLAGMSKPATTDRKEISEIRQAADSPTTQLECTLALLEFAFHQRLSWRHQLLLAQDCIRMSDDSTEMIIRLQVMSLAFRVFARRGKYVEASEVFSSLNALLRRVTGNLEDRYLVGLIERLEVDQLMREYDLLEKRKKAGAIASLVA